MNSRRAAAGIVLVCIVMAIVLRTQGRVWWCACGGWNPFSWDVWTSHNSQHLIDPYSFTHVLHGVLFAGALRWLRPGWSNGAKAFASAVVEALWEIVENSSFIINRYREATMSLDYYGDSIVNSLGDVATCLLGFALARWIGIWKSIVFFLITEVILLFWIRDNLLLNIIMLIHPIDAIKEWQMNH